MIERVRELFEKKDFRQLSELLKELEVPEAVEILEQLQMPNLILFFRLLPKDMCADVFAYLPAEDKRTIIDTITDKEMIEIMEDLYFDDMIDFLEEMPANVVDRILAKTDEQERRLINQFLKYPVDSAGSIMTIEYVELKKEMTVEDALLHIKEVGLDKETVYTCYVTDEKRVLRGIVSLRNLVTAEKDVVIKDLMKENYIAVNTLDDQEEVAQIFRDYGFIALPVVDKENRLTGIITFDDIVLVIDEENTEDMEKMGGLLPSKTEYLDTNVIDLAKKRIPWLLILMISATFTGFVIQGYEDVLASTIILSSFIPMLMDTGGNAGSQASTIIIRGMALGEIALKDFFKVLRKEVTVGALVGIVVAGINFLRLYFLDSRADFSISVTVTVTLFSIVLLAKTTGCVLPFLAAKLKLDPAIMAGPLITTVVDAVALVIYFQIASTIIGL